MGFFMTDYLNKWYDSFIAFFIDTFTQILDFFIDLPIVIIDEIFKAVILVLNAIPVPDFLTTNLQSYLSGLDPGVLNLLSVSGLAEAFAILGTGFLFRIIRKNIPFLNL